MVDAGNGMGGLTALPLYRNLGFEVVDMYCEPDGTFPNHHADPTVAENLAELQKEVVAQKADVGIAFDGDADRLGVIDRQGEIIWGDQLMIVLSRALLREVPGAVILSEVKSSRTLYDDIKERGGQAVMWRTGHSIMKQKMQEIDAALAGEMSGHVFYKHRFYGFDDAVYAGGRLLEILSHDESAASISEQLSDVPTTFSTPELRVECAEDKKVPLMRALMKNFEQDAPQHGFRIIGIDGARLEWEDGWGLVRCSNTTPLLITRYEATSESRLEKIRAYVEGVIKGGQAALA